MHTIHRNIVTLEQPIEYQLPLIRQTEIQEKGALALQRGCVPSCGLIPMFCLWGKSVIQKRPPLFYATMTGHPVYTTLHAGDCLGVIQRLVDLGLKREDLLPNLRRLSISVWCDTFVPSAMTPKDVCPLCHNRGFLDAFPWWKF